MQVATAPVPANVQVPVKVPVPLLVKVTLPVGVLVVPGDESVTVAVHVVATLTATEAGVHETLVVVVRLVTVMFAVPLLPEWVESPL